LPLLRSFSAFVPEPKNRTRPAGPLLEIFSTLHAEVRSFVDTITISDISSLTHYQQQNLADLPALSDTWRSLHSLISHRVGRLHAG
jgi:hypothetical protein